MIDRLNDLLTKICQKLSGGSWFGQGACNYVVNVKLFQENVKPNLNDVELVEKLIPNSIVGDIKKSDLSELLKAVKECFEYSGDECSYPNQKYFTSEEFKNDLGQLLEQIKILFSENLGISEFWLKQGHPFYPVYWHYAFLIRKSDSYFVLIGSSSD